jgi:hypothetical protein
MIEEILAMRQLLAELSERLSALERQAVQLYNQPYTGGSGVDPSKPAPERHK